MKKLLLLASLFALGCGVAGLMVLRRPASDVAAPPSAKGGPALAPAPSTNESPPSAPPPEGPVGVAAAPATMRPEAPEPSAPAPAKSPAAAPPPAKSAKQPKEPLKDPVARDALALVGVDPLAEQYWYAAINDPDLSAHERQDLIEDLNEDGLSDPKNPAPEDLPVILARLRVIEQSAPYAMDDVNADAFQEAYKDLVNLADRVLGGGQPVR